jgi:DNA polymerase I-like protein with 3'-5' exonuclease and polymerase domains
MYHDELVYEVEESVKERAEAIIVTAMDDVFARSPIPVAEATVPLAVSTGSGHRLDELK